MSDTELLAQPYSALLLYPPLSFSLCDMPKRVKIQKYKQREKLYENAAQTRHNSASVRCLPFTQPEVRQQQQQQQ